MKSYWQTMSCTTERDKAAIVGWFSPLCDDMVPEKAEILCDRETDKEKKLRALMVDTAGVRRWAERTLGKKSVSISLRLAP